MDVNLEELMDQGVDTISMPVADVLRLGPEYHVDREKLGNQPGTKMVRLRISVPRTIEASGARGDERMKTLTRSEISQFPRLVMTPADLRFELYTPMPRLNVDWATDALKELKMFLNRIWNIYSSMSDTASLQLALDEETPIVNVDGVAYLEVSGQLPVSMANCFADNYPRMVSYENTYYIAVIGRDNAELQSQLREALAKYGLLQARTKSLSGKRLRPIFELWEGEKTIRQLSDFPPHTLYNQEIYTVTM